MAEPAFVSYAQHGEDVILWRALGGRPNVRYVDVGAFDPTYDSVTKALYERGWRGVNIEAQADRLAAFEAERPEDVNLALAIGDYDGRATLTERAVAGWSTVLDTDDSDATSRVDVPIRTLATLLPELGFRDLDVLKVDVEGAEPQVVRGMLAGRVRPVVCVVEGVAPQVGTAAGEEAVSLLADAGYHHCLFDGLNHWLTLDESLIPSLSVPAGPMDSYITAAVNRLITERALLIETIGRVDAENAALRRASPAAESRGPATLTGTPTDAEQSGLDATDGSVDTEEPETPDEGAIPSRGTDPLGRRSGPHPDPLELPGTLPADPAPTIDPEEREARRRATWRRLLSDRQTETLPSPAPTTRRSSLDPTALRHAAPADAVTMLFRTILGRDPDPAGLAAWTSRVESGEMLVSVGRALASSAEARLRPVEERATIAAELDTWSLLVALDELGVPDSATTTAWTRGRIRHEILVHALFEVGLGRLPTAEERDHELTKLDHGVGRDRLVRAFAARPDVIAGHLGPAPTNPIDRLRRWRDMRHHQASFRTAVLTIESRHVLVLQLLAARGRAETEGRR